MDKKELIVYLHHVAEIYQSLNGSYLEVAICGGTALNLSGLLDRPTKDVDVVSPENWPQQFQTAVLATAEKFALKTDWMNPGPVDLLKLGLPKGYFQRCQRLPFQKNLHYLITSRLDQIYFKLYACIDRGGYHVTDLQVLQPSEEELFQAAKWCFTHDVSETFRTLMIDFMQKMGWSNVAKKLEI